MTQITEKTDLATQRRIKSYLSDEEKLLNDWYHGLNQLDADPDITPVGSLPPENIEKIFEEWFDGNKGILIKICQKWFKLKGKDDSTTPILIACLADLLTYLCMDFTVPVNLPATACVLYTKGYIDRLCTEKAK